MAKIERRERERERERVDNSKTFYVDSNSHLTYFLLFALPFMYFIFPSRTKGNKSKKILKIIFSLLHLTLRSLRLSIITLTYWRKLRRREMK